jgi:hypothetical protein
MHCMMHVGAVAYMCMQAYIVVLVLVALRRTCTVWLAFSLYLDPLACFPLLKVQAL